MFLSSLPQCCLSPPLLVSPLKRSNIVIKLYPSSPASNLLPMKIYLLTNSQARDLLGDGLPELGVGHSEHNWVQAARGFCCKRMCFFID